MAIDVRTVRRRCAAGKLKSLCVAGRWHVDPDATPQLRLAGGDFSAGPAIEGTPLAGLSAAKRTAIARRYEVASAYLASREQMPAAMSVHEFDRLWVEAWNAANPDNQTARTTLRRHVRKLRAGGISALADGRGYHGPASISPEALDMILGLYCVQQRPHLPAVYERVQHISQINGWQLPSLRTVQRIVAKRVDRRVVELGRDPKKYRDRCTPTAERDWTQVHAMECWVADHRLLDIWVPRRWWDRKARAERVTWQRPWLTLYLDARSWKPVSRAIEFDDPNAQRVMSTFIAGVNEHGLPADAYLDNGKDFRANRFGGGRSSNRGSGGSRGNQRQDGVKSKMSPSSASSASSVAEKRITPLLELLGVDVHWAIPYNARAKVVEVFFGIVGERFDKNWETYCGNSPQSTPEQLKGLKAEDFEDQLNIDMVREAFDAWLTEDYCLRESPSNACRGMSVDEAFYQLRPADYVERRPAREDLAILLLPSRAVQVRANGIAVAAFGGMTYNSDDVEFERRRGTRQKVTYRYSEHDPSFVYIFCAETDRFICCASPYEGAGIHPLAAPGSEDADRLADVMAAQRRLAKRHKAELTMYQKFAGNVLLASQAQAARETGLHRPVPSAPCPVPAVVIPLLEAGELSKAHQAARDHERRRGVTSAAAASALELMATGTDDTTPHAPIPTAIELLAGATEVAEEAEENPRRA